MVNVLILFTIVVLDPFKWVDYERSNLYIISKGKKYQVKVYEGNKCLERDGCYEAEGYRSPKKLASSEEVIYIPMPMQGSFSFDDLFNQ